LKKWLLSVIAVILILSVWAVTKWDRGNKPEEIKHHLAESSQTLPVVFQHIGQYFNNVKIPVYVPAYLPGDGPYRLVEFETSRDGYNFEVVATKKPPQPPVKEAIDEQFSMAGMVVTMSASQKPFTTFPMEEQLFSNPSGTVDIDGTKANSYENSMEVTWTKGSLEFYAIGHAQQDGIRVAKEIIKALPADDNLVSGALKGKFRASQLGNPMYVDASWTYDGKTWYTLSGRSSPEGRVKMLQSVTQIK